MNVEGKKRKSMDQFMAFQDPLEREFWYHIIVEVQAGWKQSQSKISKVLARDTYNESKV